MSLESLVNGLWTFQREQDERQIVASATKGGIRVCATEEELRPFPAPRRLPGCERRPPA